MKEARHHHYIPQCYLRGFTKSGGKNSKLIVLDASHRKHYETTPRNVGGIRDFNRMNIDGISPDILERELSSFEGAVAKAIRDVEATLIFSEKNRELIMNLIALLSIRNPGQRENWRDFQERVVKKVLGLALATEERWQLQMERIKKDGIEINEDVTYKEMKEFVESGRYKIMVPRERHIKLEFEGIKAVLPYLSARNWEIVISTKESGPFVTSDYPITLVWLQPEKIPPVYRQSPGFGMMHTQVVFTLSKNIALIGAFEGSSDVTKGSIELVAGINRRIIAFSHGQVYAPKLSFNVEDSDGRIVHGIEILYRQ